MSARTAAPNHLVCGSGGSRAILASAGAIHALQRAGFKHWRTLGGVSGGSIPTVLLAAGWQPAELIKMAVEVDFSSLLTRNSNLALTFLAFLLKERLAQTRPRRAVLGSEKLGTFIDERVPVWPDNYWTMAVAGRTQVFFSKDGVFQYLHDGTCRRISREPAPVGLAIRASCAVPGIIEPVLYKGIYLFDGALSWDGQCPIGAVVQHFGARPASVIGCDVGDRESRFSALAHGFWRIFCGHSCVWPVDEQDPELWRVEGTTVVTPALNNFASLQFKLTADQKWDAVMTSYAATVSELWKTGLINNRQMVELATAVTDPDRFQTSMAQK